MRTAWRMHRQSASISFYVHVQAHGYVCLLAQTGIRRSLTTFLAGYCIEAGHAGEAEETEDGNDRRHQPTCDVHLHAAGAGPNAVGSITHIGAGQVVGHRTLEEQGVVLDFHIREGGQGAVQAVVTERGNKTDAVK